jgi:hypothetical protein
MPDLRHRGYAATHLVLHSELWKGTQVKYPDRLEPTVHLAKGRVLVVPVRLALEDARGLNDLGVIERAADKLDANWQTVLSETARHADSREAADIADAADRIREGQRLIQVSVELAGRDGQ